ncbi:hypothetical protein F4803DRAFT_282349 [Xylaria telfairii]|nr:hypothetical protein F4803DRAFT_282349 [Xylaria telfairii]
MRRRHRLGLILVLRCLSLYLSGAERFGGLGESTQSGTTCARVARCLVTFCGMYISVPLFRAISPFGIIRDYSVPASDTLGYKDIVLLFKDMRLIDRCE